MVSIQNKIQLENLVTGTSVYFEWVALLGNTSDVKKPGYLPRRQTTEHGSKQRSSPNIEIIIMVFRWR